MNFEDLLNDIEKLKGLRLESIHPGSEIILIEIDRKNSKIIIENKNRKKIPRPFSQIRIIWEQLCEKRPLDVEKALKGGGSSRNQPETIFANLPYVEWLKIESRKHILFVGRHTHEFGTLKEVDSFRAEEYRSIYKNDFLLEKPLTSLIVTNKIAETCNLLEKISGHKVSMIESGIYELEYGETRLMIVKDKLVLNDLAIGSYVVLDKMSVPQNTVQFKIGQHELYTLCDKELNIVVKSETSDY